MRKGQNYEFKIETTQFPATGIANADGLKCYIKNAAQGQTVRARVTKKRIFRG